MGRFNVVFAVDENYVRHLCVALISLLKCNNNEFFRIYIINGGFSDDIFRKIEAVSKGLNCELVNVTIDDGIFEKLITNHHFTKANYYRLLIPEFINEDKILYLDSDIVINGKIDELYNVNLGDYYIAAVENPGFCRHSELRMNHDSGYFNSGVMLINLEKWKRDELAKKVISFVEANPEVIEFVDQCGLNAVIDGNWKRLKLKYNLQAVIFEEDFSDRYNCFPIDELIEAEMAPVIVHFTGSSKPWHLRNRHPYKYLYLKYKKMTPYWYSLPPDLTLLNVIKWLVPDFIKGRISNFMRER